MPKIYTYILIENVKYEQTNVVDHTLANMGRTWLEGRGLSDKFMCKGEYGYCIEHGECKFTYRFSRQENNILRVESRDQHSGGVTADYKKEQNLEKYSKFKPEVAMRAMERDGIPVEERPPKKSLENYRTKFKPKSQQEPAGRTVFTFQKFLESPPRGVQIDEETKVVEPDNVLVAFSLPDVVRHVVQFWHDEVEVNLCTDATYGTNEQDLTLLGLNVLGLYEDLVHHCVRNATIPIYKVLGTGK